ncbi:RNA exonuclease 5 isoform X2 [Octopus vulgaris]|uniref:RNA exonuclease 5 isoform X2 n=3 Tax=Octopus TaxID=6643 RepID=A0AA36BJE4_OCTVU|nr:RNA exonuclease 5 isoform X2 [Octopus vulgaris]
MFTSSHNSSDHLKKLKRKYSAIDEDNLSTKKKARQERKINKAISLFTLWSTNPRKKQKTNYPQINLKFPSLDVGDAKADTPSQSPSLFITDIQQLILNAVLKGDACMKPRWCELKYSQLISSTFVIVLKSVSIKDFKKYHSCFPNVCRDFNKATEVISSAQFGISTECEFFKVQINSIQLFKYGTKKHQKNLFQKAIQNKVSSVSPNTIDAFPRTLLLLNLLQMARENYPLPIKSKWGFYDDYIFSKESYEKVTDKSPIFGLDCEMCKTSDGVYSLTRVSLVNEKLETVYDTLVKPKHKIIDYLFRYSGINEEMMRPVCTTLKDVQNKFRTLLPKDAILCGHSLNFDLDSLKMFHPYVIDTSTIYNLSGFKYQKSKLKKLTEYFLGKQIQTGDSGHNSVEDAAASLQLVQLKLKNSIEFGDVILDTNLTIHKTEACNNSTPVYKESSSPNTKQTNEEGVAVDDNRKFFVNMSDSATHRSFFDLLNEHQKKSLVIDARSVIDMYSGEPGQRISHGSDEEIVSTAQKKLYDNDFMWLQLNSFHNLLQTNTDSKEADIQKCLQTLDSHVGTLMKTIFSKALVTLILTGRDNEDEDYQNGMTLVKIS